MSDASERLRLLEQDHTPDGWPAVQMRDITAVLDELERLKNPWQPISDAAKTGEDVLLFDSRFAHDCRTDVGSWRTRIGESTWVCRWISKDGNYLIPTHWMAIPPVPSGVDSGRAGLVE